MRTKEEETDLEMYKEIWNRITPDITPEGWEPDEVQLFIKKKIEDLE